MDWPVILAKISGIVLLVFTGRSIYRHILDRRRAAAAGQKDKQSMSERVLNGVLLYAWYAFMLAFSLGLFFNNHFNGE